MILPFFAQTLQKLLYTSTETYKSVEAILYSLDILHEKMDGLKRTVFQLHENTIPRVFIILPEDGKWDFSVDSLFTKNHRLYFLCEHIETLKDGKEKSCVHLAGHEGYRIQRPREVNYFHDICLLCLHST